MFTEFHSSQSHTIDKPQMTKEEPMNQISSAVALLMSGFNTAMMATALGNQSIVHLPGTSTPAFTPPFTPAVTPPTSNVQLAPSAANTTINFPEITTFLQRLADEDPRRHFDGLGEKLAAKKYFHIDELEDENATFFQEEPYYLLEGDAKFLVRRLRTTISTIRNNPLM